MIDLSVKLPGLDLKNPVIPASGCYGFGREFSELYDLGRLGGLVTKSVTLHPRAGNEVPRLADTPMGMLNSIGLENKGVEKVMEYELPFLEHTGCEVIVSVAGSQIEEYVEVLRRLAGQPAIKAFEINASCPNVKQGAITFGVDPEQMEKLTKACKKAADKPVYMKLSPNVTDIAMIAKAAQTGGADGIVLINTLRGMAIDLKSGKPLLANITGGLSGPAIKPVALAMVYECAKAVDLPIIGCGGIESARDVLEFLNAGASAVEIGAANFHDPMVCMKIIDELPSVLEQYGYASLEEAIGKAHE